MFVKVFGSCDSSIEEEEEEEEEVCSILTSLYEEPCGLKWRDGIL
jgi:hypothetical protein